MSARDASSVGVTLTKGKAKPHGSINNGGVEARQRPRHGHIEGRD